MQVFIADIRNCQTKELEQQRVEKELSKIRLKFANPKSLSGYDKKKYVWKLLYAYMLGYDIDFGHFQAQKIKDLDFALALARRLSCAQHQSSVKRQRGFALRVLVEYQRDDQRCFTHALGMLYACFKHL